MINNTETRKARLSITQYTTQEIVDAAKNPAAIIHAILFVLFIITDMGFLVVWFAFAVALLATFFELYKNELNKLAGEE